MKARKTFLTAATAVTVAVAGTGIASAADEATDTDGSTPTAGSAELSAERDVFGSVTGADALGSWTGDQFDYEKASEALVSIAAVGAGVATIAGAYVAVVDASDAFQGVVSDSQAWLENTFG